MTRRLRPRSLFRLALFLLAAALVAPTVWMGEAVGQAHVDKGGTVGIQNETEKNLFFSVICMCGCPRETLGTCTCDYGNDRRAELREMLAAGLTFAEIHTAYEKRFGTQALAVPPNRGANPLMWAVPVIGIAAGAFFVIRMLRRWARAGEGPTEARRGRGDAKEGPDEYDQRLDDELKELDKE